MKIVLLPGLDGTGVLFRPFLGYLPPSLEPVVVSYSPSECLTYAELLPLVMRNLPTDSPFVLLGESFSGPLALMAAAKRPSGLKAVVLCATFIQNPTWLRWRWLARLVHPFAFRLYPEFSAVKALLGGYSSRELKALVQEAIGAVRPEVLACRVREVLKVNARQELAACGVPILYLRGSRDFVVPGRNFREIRAALPSLHVATLQAPHMVLQTQPVASAAAITKFVGETIIGFR